MRSLAVTFVLAVALALGTTAALTSTDPIALDDVVKLLQAKVSDSIILKQASLAGLSFKIGVGEILRLKEAGASDALIEALMKAEPASGETPSATAPEGSSKSFRIYKEKSADGEEILHITNLDPSGRRMGGEVVSEPPAPVNRYEDREEAAPRDDAYSVIGEPTTPVVVNVYPPDGGYAEPAVSPYMYTDPYSYLYPRGRLPGLYAYGSYGYPYRGYSMRYPPGSYSHFLAYHTHYGGPGLGCGFAPGQIVRPPVPNQFGPRFIPQHSWTAVGRR